MPFTTTVLRPTLETLVAATLALIVLFLVAKGLMAHAPGVALSAMPLAMLAVGLLISAAIAKTR